MKDSPENLGSMGEYQWERGWDEHESMQLQRLARLPLAEKLLWLEQAHRVVIQLQASQSIRSEFSQIRNRKAATDSTNFNESQH